MIMLLSKSGLVSFPIDYSQPLSSFDMCDLRRPFSSGGLFQRATSFAEHGETDGQKRLNKLLCYRGGVSLRSS